MKNIDTTLLPRWIILNASLVAMFAAAFYYGVLDRFLIDDTFITHGIIAFFAVVLISNLRTVWAIHHTWKTVGDRKLVYASERAAGRDAEQRDLLVEELSRFMSGYKLAGTILVSLGLLGTVIGILLAFGGVSPDIIGDPDAAAGTIVMLLSGLTTAFNTTLVGIVGMIWNTINLYLMKTDISRFFTTVVSV